LGLTFSGGCPNPPYRDWRAHTHVCPERWRPRSGMAGPRRRRVTPADDPDRQHQVGEEGALNLTRQDEPITSSSEWPVAADRPACGPFEGLHMRLRAISLPLPQRWLWLARRESCPKGRSVSKSSVVLDVQGCLTARSIDLPRLSVGQAAFWPMQRPGRERKEDRHDDARQL